MFERICDQCGRKDVLAGRIRSNVCKKCSGAKISAAKAKNGHVEMCGYRAIYVNRKKVYEHRHVMEMHLGRKLSSKEHVHHKDENRLNNDVSSLELISASEHAHEHWPKRVRDEFGRFCGNI